MSNDPEAEGNIMRLFMKYDANGDAMIASDEFASMMRDLNPDAFGEPEAINTLLETVDSDASGQVDYRELMQWILGGGDTPRQAYEAVEQNLLSGRRKRCQFGESCRRTGRHRQMLCHPEDWDWELEGDERDGLDGFSTVGGEEERDALNHDIGDPPEDELQVPDYWAGGNDEMSLCDVPEDVKNTIQSFATKSWKKVKTSDRHEGEMPTGIRIVSIQRVENNDLWQKYASERYKIGAKRPHKCTPYDRIAGQTLETDFTDTPLDVGLKQRVNEVYLWHGTSHDGAVGIAGEGFRVDLAGSNAGNLYGPGAYLAECASKADEYSESAEGSCSMLLCRVVLGEQLHMSVGGESTHMMINMAISSGSYDSVLGDREASVGTYKEFVVYKSEQVYPEYIIQYERAGLDDGAQGNLPDEPLPDEVLPDKLPKKLIVVVSPAMRRLEFTLSTDLQNGTLLFYSEAKTIKIGATSDRSNWQLASSDDNTSYHEAPYEGPIPPTSGWERTQCAGPDESIYIEIPPELPPPLRRGYIENVSTGLVLDITGANRKRGAVVSTWRKNGNLNQLWTLTPEGKIQSALNNLVIGVGGYKKNRGQYMVMWNDGGADKFWELTPQGQLVNKWSRLCMGCCGGNRNPGTKIIQWNVSTYWDKVWKFSEHPRA